MRQLATEQETGIVVINIICCAALFISVFILNIIKRIRSTVAKRCAAQKYLRGVQRVQRISQTRMAVDCIQ